MSLELKYRSSMSGFITIQQVKNETDYQQLSIVNNEIKLIEERWLRKGVNKKHIKVYLGVNENKNDVLNEHSENINQTYTISFNKETFGEYNLWSHEEYSFNKLLKFKGKHVLDKQFRLIMHCGFDIVSNELKTGGVKYYYLGENLLYLFHYDETGDLDHIIDVQYMFGSDSN